MHILIAIPTYGGMSSEAAGSILRLQAHLLARGITVDVAQHSMAEIARSRNILSSIFFENTQMTHLLFIDSDMVFAPEVVQRLIDIDKPLVGCIYPKRSLNLDALIAAARVHQDRALIIASALEFVVHHHGDVLSVEDGLCSVAGIGMGVCLISRQVLVELQASGQISEDWAAAKGRLRTGPVFGFFDQIPIETGLLAEDLSFCQRWRELCCGEVFGVADQDVGHLGDMAFRGRFIDALEAHTRANTKMSG